MGIKNSKVGWFSFIGGCTGYTTGMLMIWFMNAFDYRIVIGGKPMFSPFSAFPPSYELTILFGSFGALLGMLFLNRLPRLHHPLLKNRRFALATHDRFFVVIETERSEVFRKRNPPAARIPGQPAHRIGGGIMRYFLLLFFLTCVAVVGHLRLSRQPLAPSAHRAVSRHGPPKQSAPADAQRIFRRPIRPRA